MRYDCLEDTGSGKEQPHLPVHTHLQPKWLNPLHNIEMRILRDSVRDKGQRPEPSEPLSDEHLAQDLVDRGIVDTLDEAAAEILSVREAFPRSGLSVIA